MARRGGSVHVATTKRTYKGKVYVTHLLRRTYREGGKVKHQTLGNLSHLPTHVIDIIRRALHGGYPVGSDEPLRILRSLPHGHVLAVLATLRRTGLEEMLASRQSFERSLVVAMIVMRVLRPGSKLATTRRLKRETCMSSLALELGIESVTEDLLYKAMDWLINRQNRIETKLAKKHLRNGTLILYDVSSSYYTGTHCTLAKRGHNRDKKNGLPQIIYGLVCSPEGCPIAIEVFEGNTGDPATLSNQIEKLRSRFQIERVVLVGDRGMITAKRIDEELRHVDGLDWITALRADSIKKLAREKVIQLEFFDERDLAEVTSPDYPGERLIVCRNPLLAKERATKRQELLAATETVLCDIQAATQRAKRPLKGKDKIALRVGKNINRYKVAKHFILEIDEERISFRRDEAKIAEEAALDGLYVIRTSVERERIGPESTVRAYKDLGKVEKAFRSLKTVDLKIRPIFHWLEGRVRAHVFLCMLAYYVEWHMRQNLGELLFDDEDKELTEALRRSIVAPAERSQTAQRKDRTKRTADDLPVHSFQTLLDDLATLTKNLVEVSSAQFYVIATPTDSQRRALDLLGVSLQL